MIRLNDIHAIKLISRAAFRQYVPTLHHCIARYDRNDCLMGGVLFTDWLGGSVLVHYAGFQPNWMNRVLIYLAFQYPFVELKVTKIFGMTPEWNWRSLRLGRHLGFQCEYKMKDVYNFKDRPNGLYIVSMHRDDCKWLHMKPPHVEFAPIERMNIIDHTLILADETQMTRQ